MYIVTILSIPIPIDTTACNFEFKKNKDFTRCQKIQSSFLLPQGNNKASTEQKLYNYKYSATDNQDFLSGGCRSMTQQFS